MHRFEVYDNVEFINDGVKEVGCIESINEQDGTAVVALEFHVLEKVQEKRFKLSELTLIPTIKVDGERLKDFIHFDCSKEQLTGGQWYTFYPEYNLLYTEDEIHVTIDDVLQGIDKIEALDMWESESCGDWWYLMRYQINELFMDTYMDSPNAKIDSDAFDLIECIAWSVPKEKEFGKEYFYEAADAIRERYRLETERAN